MPKPPSKKKPGQPKKGHVRFTAHILPATQAKILAQKGEGRTLGSVLDELFMTH